MAVEKRWVIFGISVLLIVVGFVAVNRYWFYPTFTAKIPSVQPYKPPGDDIGNPQPITITETAGTLKIIHNFDFQKVAVTKDFAANKDRCPFLWPGEGGDHPPPPPPPPSPKAIHVPKLGMIVIGENGTGCAMLDHSLVHQGERYKGHFVEDITPQYVILSGNYGVLKISIPARSFGSPKVDILEQTNPDLLEKPVAREKK